MFPSEFFSPREQTQWCFFFKALTGSDLWSGLRDRHSTFHSFTLCLSSCRNLAYLPWSMKRAIFRKPQTVPCWRSYTINTLYVKTCQPFSFLSEQQLWALRWWVRCPGLLALLCLPHFMFCVPETEAFLLPKWKKVSFGEAGLNVPKFIS